MVGIAFIRISDSGNKRFVPEILSLSNSLGLCWVVSVRYSRSVCVFQNIMRDCATFRTALRFWFDIDICHSSCPPFIRDGV